MSGAAAAAVSFRPDAYGGETTRLIHWRFRFVVAVVQIR